MKLKAKKCNLFCTEVTFLGHVVSREGVRPDPNNVAKVQQWSAPTDVSEKKAILKSWPEIMAYPLDTGNMF